MADAKTHGAAGSKRSPWQRPRSWSLLFWSISLSAFTLFLASSLTRQSLLLAAFFGILAAGYWWLWWNDKRHFALGKTDDAQAAERDAYTDAITDRDNKLTPQEFYHKVWKLVADHYLHRVLPDVHNKIAEMEHIYDGRLPTMEDACMALQDFVSSLDKYSYLHDARQRVAMEEQWHQIKLVRSSVHEGNVGYVRLITFGETRAVDELRAALKSLSKCDSYVLDLRYNGGGKVSAALSVLGMLMEQGLVATSEGALPHIEGIRHYQLTKDALEVTFNGAAHTHPREANLTGDKPLIVLVNEHSASASELVTGTLRDGGRAKVVGSKTYGKGVGQDLYLLEFGVVLRLTTARFRTPSGVCLDGEGITPEHSVKSGRTRYDRQWSAAWNVARSEGALTQHEKQQNETVPTLGGEA